MSKRALRRELMCSLVTSVLCAAATDGAVAQTLRVCVDKASASAQIDQRLAAEVAHIEGMALAVQPFDGSGDDDGYAIRNFRKMAAKTCDLVMGFPVDRSDAALPAGLAATAAYAHAGFVLVTPKGSPVSDLAGFPQGTDVGVTYLTTPNLYFEKHPNLRANVFDTEDETVQSLVHHEVAAAMLWRPTIVHYMMTHAQAAAYDTHDLNEPHAQYDIVALYLPASKGVATKFEDGVARLRTDGRLPALLAPYASADAAPMKRTERDEARPLRVLVETDAAATQAGTPPALYTNDQASAGQHDFMSNCAVCHSPDLTGRAGPALKGKNFASVKANFHVGDVFKIVSQNMPATCPASLPQQTYVEIMAFLLQQNGYPAGAAPLTFDGASASGVPLLYHGQ